MAGWFARLMQTGHARSPRTIVGAKQVDAGQTLSARDPRFDAVVEMLRAREADDRAAREKRQRGYRQSLEGDAATATDAPASSTPIRLNKLRTKVPCRMTPDARALLDDIRSRFPDGTITFPQLAMRKQALMLTAGAGAEPRQIGWVEHCVQTDSTLCNVREQGLSVETDDGAMLVLRFRHPPTAVKVSSELACRPIDEMVAVDFTEIRPALDLRPAQKASSPRLVWMIRPEVETMNALQSRDYEAFYVRFKLEVQAGIWNSLSALLSSAPGSQWHRGTCYTVVREPDAANRRIHERTVNDSGTAVDIGADRIHDAGPATDILLLYLEGDILTDFADIYFTLQSLPSADAYFLKEEFFTIVRRFWTSSKSLARGDGSDLATVVRISQRVLPMPTQAPLVKQDWTNLRQSLVDRYGERGRKAAKLIGQAAARPRVRQSVWPFETFPAGEVNVGLRLVYRQEWRRLDAERGEVIRTVPAAATVVARSLDELVAQARSATIEVMKWQLDLEGSIQTGIRALASTTEMGLESECRESSRETSTRLSDIMRKMAGRVRGEAAVGAESEEVVTRLVEIQNVVLVAERLPTPAEIDLFWVRRHDWILTKALLDESFRDALNTIRQEPRTPQRGLELDAKRDSLYEHIRANVLHYQRAIWRREDPQQRSMRYRKSGKKVPLEWRFELESGGPLTIDELCDRLAAPDVDGQFASYSQGREAELDQLVDPAGPIAYYGNYAVYRMRAEFGSKELFSMLHFFKSPYLRPNPETGEPEVEDPERIQLSADPTVVAASDQLIARQRDEVARNDAALRQELAEAQEATSAEADPGASGAALASDQLVLENRDGIELLSAIGHQSAEHEWSILRSGEPKSCLLAGVGVESARAHYHEPKSVILARSDSNQLPSIIAGRARDPRDERVILASSGDGRGLFSGAVIGTAAAHEHVILSGRDEDRTPTLSAGAGRPDAQGPVIFARVAGRLTLAPDVGRAPSEAQPRATVSRGEGDCELTLNAGAGAPNAGEQVIVGRVGGGLRLIAAAGSGVDHPHERVILAGENGWLRPSLIAG